MTIFNTLLMLIDDVKITREKITREKIIKEMKNITERVKSENRDFTQEESILFDELNKIVMQ